MQIAELAEKAAVRAASNQQGTAGACIAGLFSQLYSIERELHGGRNETCGLTDA